MKPDPIKIFAVEVFNLNTSAIFSGQPIPKGCLGVTVNREPNLVYRQVGSHFIAEDSGIVSTFTLVPGSTDGFAGREITLPVIGQGKVFSRKGITYRKFKGSLWSSYKGTEAAAEVLGQPVRSIGLKTPRERGVYCSYHCTQEFIDRLSRVVMLGEPESSPLL